MTRDSTKEHVASTATSTAMNLNGRSSVIQLINIPGGGGAGKAGQGREKRRGREGGVAPDGGWTVRGGAVDGLAVPNGGGICDDRHSREV
jgi:hypothetical protein